MDEPSSSADNGSGGNPSSADADEIQWRFSQIKGNIETDEAPTDGRHLSYYGLLTL